MVAEPDIQNTNRRFRFADFMKRAGMSLGSLLVLLACGSTEPKITTLTFEGTITAAATGVPISGATVSFGDGSGLIPAIGKSTTTDTEGQYTLTHDRCFRNPYLFVFAPGFYSDQKEVGCQVARQTIHFSLTRDPLAP